MSVRKNISLPQYKRNTIIRLLIEIRKRLYNPHYIVSIDSIKNKELYLANIRAKISNWYKENVYSTNEYISKQINIDHLVKNREKYIQDNNFGINIQDAKIILELENLTREIASKKSKILEHVNLLENNNILMNLISEESKLFKEINNDLCNASAELNIDGFLSLNDMCFCDEFISNLINQSAPMGEVLLKQPKPLEENHLSALQAAVNSPQGIKEKSFLKNKSDGSKSVILNLIYSAVLPKKDKMLYKDISIIKTTTDYKIQLNINRVQSVSKNEVIERIILILNRSIDEMNKEKVDEFIFNNPNCNTTYVNYKIIKFSYNKNDKKAGIVKKINLLINEFEFSNQFKYTSVLDRLNTWKEFILWLIMLNDKNYKGEVKIKDFIDYYKSNFKNNISDEQIRNHIKDTGLEYSSNSNYKLDFDGIKYALMKVKNNYDVKSVFSKILLKRKTGIGISRDKDVDLEESKIDHHYEYIMHIHDCILNRNFLEAEKRLKNCHDDGLITDKTYEEIISFLDNKKMEDDPPH